MGAPPPIPADIGRPVGGSSDSAPPPIPQSFAPAPSGNPPPPIPANIGRPVPGAASASTKPAPSLVRDFGAGVVKGVEGLGRTALDVLEPSNPMDRYYKPGAAVDKAITGAMETVADAAGSLPGVKQATQWADATHPTGLAGAAAQGAGEVVPFAAGMLGPDELSGMGKLLSLAGLAGMGAASGVGQKIGAGVGQNIAGKEGAQVGGVLGALVGGIAPALTGYGAAKLAEGVLDAVPATAASKARWAAQNLQHFEPDLAAARDRISQPGSALQIGQDIVHRGPNGEILPGSAPTSVQLAGSQGLARLGEALKTTGEGAPLNEAEGAQSAARAAAVRGVGSSPGADPSAVASFLRQRFQAEDAAAAGDEQAAAAARTGAVAQQPGATGVVTPYQAGAAVRDTLAEQDQIAKARTEALYQKIAERNPVVDMSPLNGTVDAIRGEVLANKGVLHGPEHDMLLRAQDLAESPDATWGQVNQLRSDLNGAITDSLDRFGQNTPVTRRLQMLKSGLNDALADAAGKVVASDPEMGGLAQSGLIDENAPHGGQGERTAGEAGNVEGGIPAGAEGEVPAIGMGARVAASGKQDAGSGAISRPIGGPDAAQGTRLGEPGNVTTAPSGPNYSAWQREYRAASAAYEQAVNEMAQAPATSGLFDAGEQSAIQSRAARRADMADARMAVAERAMQSLAENQEPAFRLSYPERLLNERRELTGNAPVGILGRIRQLGGIRPDAGGELAARDLTKLPGIVSANAPHSIESMAVRLAEEGYLPDLQRDMQSGLAPEVNRHQALLDAVDAHRMGMPVYAEEEGHAYQQATAYGRAFREAQQEAAQWVGLDSSQAKALTRGQVLDILAERASSEDMAKAYAAAHSAVEDPDLEAAINEEMRHGYLGRNAEPEGPNGGGDYDFGRPEEVSGIEAQSGRNGEAFGESATFGRSDGSETRPTFSVEDAENYQAALASHRARKQLFANPMIGPLLRRSGGDLAMAPEEVVKQIVAPGPKGAQMARALKSAAASDPAILSHYQTAIGLDIRRAAVEPDGTINLSRLNSWRKAHAPMLAEIPEVNQRLDTMAGAQSLVETAVAKRAAVRDAYQTKAIQSFLNGEDPAVAMSRVLSGSPADARAFLNKIKADPQALAGARQAMADRLATDLLTPTAGAENGAEQVRIATLKGMLRNPAKTQILREFLGPQAPARLRQIVQDFDAYNSASMSRINVGGSRTTPLAQTARELAQPKTLLGRVLSSWTDPVAIAASALPTGVAGEAAAQAAGAMFRGWRGKHLAAATELLAKALADPKVFLEVTRPVPSAAPAAEALMRRARQAIVNSYVNGSAH